MNVVLKKPAAILLLHDCKILEMPLCSCAGRTTNERTTETETGVCIMDDRTSLHTWGGDL